MKHMRINAKVAVLIVVTSILLAVMWSTEASLKSVQASQPMVGEVVPRAHLPLIIGPCKQGALVFNDDFSDPESGWLSWDNEQSAVGYLDGEFRILVRDKESRAGLAGAASGVSPGYRLTANVRNVADRAGHYGLIFGFSGGQSYSFYTFEVNRSGEYFLYYHQRIHPDPMETTLLHTGWSDSVRVGTAVNQLAVIHRPATIYLYANGQLLTTAPSSKTGADQLGMLATSTSDSNLDIRYDNFEVYEYFCEPAG